MEQQDLLNKKVGDKELPKLEPKDIEVQGVKVEEVGEKKKMDILKILCKHPDKNELIEFTKIKISKNDRLKVIGLWYQEDEDGNIQKGSSVDTLINLAGVDTLGELVGKMLPTIYQSDDNDYLCIKGYQ